MLEALEKVKSSPARQAMLKLLMAKPDTLTRLQQRTGRSQRWVLDEVKALRKLNLVEDSAAGKNQPVRLKPMAGVAVGVELGFQHIRVVARRAHESHVHAAGVHKPVGAAQGKERWLDNLVAAIREAVSRAGGSERLTTIGMGVPRVVDPRLQKLVEPLFPPWHDFADPAQALSERLQTMGGLTVPDGLQVHLDNDANLGAYAEHLYEHPDRDPLVYVKASTGVGAGIMVSGRLVRGATGCAGEIGHTVVEPGGPFCLCGGRGCLETLVGADAMLRAAQMRLGGSHLPPPRDIDDLIKQATATSGSPICQRILHDAAFLLGRSIGNLCNLINPDVIVLGGVFGRPETDRLTIDACTEGLRDTAMAAALGEHRDGGGSPGGQPGRQRSLVVVGTLRYPSAHGALLVGIDGHRGGE